MADKKEEKKEKVKEDVPAPEEQKETLKEKEPEQEQITAQASKEAFENFAYEPDPMLDPEPRKHPKSVDPKSVIFGILVAIIIVVAMFVFIEKKTVETPTPAEAVVEEKIELSPVAVKYNFEPYLTKDNIYADTDLTVIGFLKHESRAVGRTVTVDDYFVVDDYGNKIMLSFLYMRNPAYFDPLFVKGGTTRDLFKVSGTYKKDTTQGYKLYVTTINPAKREYVTQ